MEEEEPHLLDFPVLRFYGIFDGTTPITVRECGKKLFLLFEKAQAKPVQSVQNIAENVRVLRLLLKQDCTAFAKRTKISVAALKKLETTACSAHPVRALHKVTKTLYIDVSTIRENSLFLQLAVDAPRPLSRPLCLQIRLELLESFLSCLANAFRGPVVNAPLSHCLTADQQLKNRHAGEPQKPLIDNLLNAIQNAFYPSASPLQNCANNLALLRLFTGLPLYGAAQEAGVFQKDIVTLEYADQHDVPLLVLQRLCRFYDFPEDAAFINGAALLWLRRRFPRGKNPPAYPRAPELSYLLSGILQKVLHQPS